MLGVYNYKGGAAKTTTAVNLSAVLAHTLGKRVLVVDADPQCNLSSFFFPELQPTDDVEDPIDAVADATAAADALAAAAAAAPVEDFPLAPDSLPRVICSPLMDAKPLPLSELRQGFCAASPNLHTFLRATMLSGSPDIDEDGLIDQIQTRSVWPGFDHDSSTLYLLPGSTRIVEFERQANSIEDWKYLLVIGALRRLINHIMKKKNIDFAIVDFGPSSSLLNLTWLSTLDCILPCCFPDYYNLSSLDGLLTTVLPHLRDIRHANMSRERERRDRILAQFREPRDREKFKKYEVAVDESVYSKFEPMWSCRTSRRLAAK